LNKVVLQTGEEIGRGWEEDQSERERHVQRAVGVLAEMACR